MRLYNPGANNILEICCKCKSVISSRGTDGGSKFLVMLIKDVV